MDDENIIWNREKKAGKEWIVHTILVKEDYTNMTFFESLGVAAICIVIVFIVLCVICLFIMLFSSILSAFTKGKKEPKKESGVKSVSKETTGDLTLENVDEKTAAVIMATVSGASGVPASKLRFKSIKLLKKE